MSYNATYSVETTLIEADFNLIRINNNEAEIKKEIREVSKDFIQIHFSIQASGKLIFNNGRYSIDVMCNKALFLYNPNEDLPINLEVDPKSKYIILLIGIDKFHSFFSKEAGLIKFLDSENKSKKYYTNKDLTTSEIVVLHDIFNFKTNSSLSTLYTRGKLYELLSIFFNKKENLNIDNCPFLKDESNVKKIINAKSIIISNIDNPPSLQELATMIELPLVKLKEGFKQIYGDTVFGFLLNYKMEMAKNMIETKSFNVAEISYKLGYSTSSHFIAAFKKKYGTTPKKYMSNLLS